MSESGRSRLWVEGVSDCIVDEVCSLPHGRHSDLRGRAVSEALSDLGSSDYADVGDFDHAPPGRPSLGQAGPRVPRRARPGLSAGFLADRPLPSIEKMMSAPETLAVRRPI